LTKGSTTAGEALLEIYDELGAALETVEASPRSAEAARSSARGLALFRTRLSRKVASVMRTHPELNEPENRTDFETAIELLQRFLRELHAYTRSYAALPEHEPASQPPDDIGFATHTDPLAALLAGVKAFVSILLVSAFWIATAWPYGASALCFVAVTSALFGSAPDQYRSVRHMTIGHGSGYLAAVLFVCLVVPSLDGFTLLGAALLPFLMIGSYIITYPRWIAIGTGYVVFFCAMLNPTNPMIFNPVSVINDGSAALLGTAIAGIVFMTLAPATGGWYKRRLAGRIRRQVVAACFEPLPGLVNRFEGRTAELMHQLDSTRHLDPDRNQRLVAWIFTVKEIGRAVIHLREDALPADLPGALADLLQESIAATARLFTRPSARRLERALDAVTLCIESIRGRKDVAPPQENEILRRLLASLHLVRSALLDNESALGAAFGAPAEQPTEEIVSAA
jgi:uncharacterized membrane protein YccC